MICPKCKGYRRLCDLCEGTGHHVPDERSSRLPDSPGRLVLYCERCGKDDDHCEGHEAATSRPVERRDGTKTRRIKERRHGSLCERRDPVESHRAIGAVGSPLPAPVVLRMEAIRKSRWEVTLPADQPGRIIEIGTNDPHDILFFEDAKGWYAHMRRDPKDVYGPHATTFQAIRALMEAQGA